MIAVILFCCIVGGAIAAPIIAALRAAFF